MKALRSIVSYFMDNADSHKNHKVKQFIHRSTKFINRIQSATTLRDIYDLLDEIPITQVSEKNKFILDSEFDYDDVLILEPIKKQSIHVIYLTDIKQYNDKHEITHSFTTLWMDNVESNCVPYVTAYKLNIKADLEILSFQIGDRIFKNDALDKTTMIINDYEFALRLLGIISDKKFKITLKGSPSKIDKPIKIHINSISITKFSIINAIILLRFYDVAKTLSPIDSYNVPRNINATLMLEESNDKNDKENTFYRLTCMLKVYWCYHNEVESYEDLTLLRIELCKHRKLIKPYIHMFLNLIDTPPDQLDYYTSICIFYYELSFIVDRLTNIVKHNKIDFFIDIY